MKLCPSQLQTDLFVSTVKVEKLYLVPQIDTLSDASLAKLLHALAQLNALFSPQSIIITVRVDRLQDDNYRTITLLTSNQPLLKKWPWLSYQLAITQVDKLCGFKEVCLHLPNPLKKAPLGLLFPSNLCHEDTEQFINQQMNYLCDQIHSLSSQAQTLIQSLQALRPQLCAIASTLSNHNQTIQGIFFTSTRYAPLFVDDWLHQKHQMIVARCRRKMHFRLWWLSLHVISACYAMQLILQDEIAFISAINKRLTKPQALTIDKLNSLEYTQILLDQRKPNALSPLSQNLNNAVKEQYNELLKTTFKKRTESAS